MPERRCVGCGRVAPKPDLLRLALETPAPTRGPRQVVVDERGTLPGRGGYLCRDERAARPDPACLRRALRRHGLERALRTAVTIPPDFVESTC